MGGRARRQGRTVTNRGLILEDRGLPHLVISHTCSEMGSDHPWRKTRAQRNMGRREDTKNRKEEKSTGFRSLGTNLKEEKENYCVDFQWKKMCLFDHWVIQNRETVQEIAQTLQWKPSVTEKSPGNQAHTHSDTITHTHLKHVDTEAAENPNPKSKDSETRTPTTTAYEAVLHCWQKSKEILARLSKIVPTKKYKQWSKIYKFTWCHIGAG